MDSPINSLGGVVLLCAHVPHFNLKKSSYNNNKKKAVWSHHDIQMGHRRCEALKCQHASCHSDATFHQPAHCRRNMWAEMSIFHVPLLFLITSDWINQQINGVPRGFDISSSIRSHRTRREGHPETVPKQCLKLTLTQLPGFKDTNRRSDF